MSPAFPYLCAFRLAKWEHITEVVSGVISFDSGQYKYWALEHQDQMVNLVIALKNQVTRMIQLVTNQVGMPIDFRDTAKEIALLSNQVKLMKNCVQIKLLTHQVGATQTKKTVQVGAAQTKTTVPTVSKAKALAAGVCAAQHVAAGVCAAQQNEYDTNAGPKLLMAARSGDASWVQTLLSAPDVQSYINYTDKDGRTPLFTAASKGHTAIVAKLICRFQRKIAGSILR
jgi:ankyrin repeat protein